MDHFCEYCIYGYAAVKQGDVIQRSALFIKMTEHECRFKSTSCSLSGVIQTLISMCLISILALHRRRVIAWLHIQCPELKLPKALALKRWINHLDFLHTTANHLGVRLTLPPLIIRIERSEAFFSRLAVPLALINGAPLLENYTGNVTLRKRVGAEPGLSFIAEGEGVPSQFLGLFLCHLLRLASRGISRNNQRLVQLACMFISMLPMRYWHLTPRLALRGYDVCGLWALTRSESFWHRRANIDSLTAWCHFSAMRRREKSQDLTVSCTRSSSRDLLNARSTHPKLRLLCVLEAFTLFYCLNNIVEL